MKIKRDQITGLVLVILGIVLLIMIGQFKKPITAEYPGPKLMPGIAALGMIICGLGIFIKGCRQKEADKENGYRMHTRSNEDLRAHESHAPHDHHAEGKEMVAELG